MGRRCYRFAIGPLSAVPGVKDQMSLAMTFFTFEKDSIASACPFGGGVAEKSRMNTFSVFSIRRAFSQRPLVSPHSTPTARNSIPLALMTRIAWGMPETMLPQYTPHWLWRQDSHNSSGVRASTVLSRPPEIQSRTLLRRTSLTGLAGVPEMKLAAVPRAMTFAKDMLFTETFPLWPVVTRKGTAALTVRLEKRSARWQRHRFCPCTR